MKKNKSEIVDDVIDFVTRYKYEKITPSAIYTESGYQSVRGGITEQDIEIALKESPHVLSYWIEFSEDQRHTPSWFFSKDGEKWKTGYIDRQGKITKELIFDEQFKACAHFIKMFFELLSELNG